MRHIREDLWHLHSLLPEPTCISAAVCYKRVFTLVMHQRNVSNVYMRRGSIWAFCNATPPAAACCNPKWRSHRGVTVFKHFRRILNVIWSWWENRAIQSTVNSFKILLGNSGGFFFFLVFFRENKFGAMFSSAVQRCQYHVGLLVGYVHPAALYTSFFGEQVSVLCWTSPVSSTSTDLFMVSNFRLHA